MYGYNMECEVEKMIATLSLIKEMVADNMSCEEIAAAINLNVYNMEFYYTLATL